MHNLMHSTGLSVEGNLKRPVTLNAGGQVSERSD